jgi:hypothetical protein
MGAMSLPLIGAVIIWRWGDRFRFSPRWLAANIFALVGVIALTLFLLSQHYACMLLSGRNNCLVEGLGTLSLFLLSILLARRSIIMRDANQAQSCILMLMLGSAWAGIGLANNLLELLLFMNLFVYVIYRWLHRQGFKFRILLLRDDYGDDSN